MSTARQAGRVAARGRVAGALLATAVALSALTGGAPLAASELPGDTAEDAADVRASSLVVQRPRGSGTNPGRATSTHFWVSSSARRGYFLANERHQGSLRGFERLVAVDLATGARTGHAELSPRAYGNPPGNLYTAQGADNAVAIDEEGGRLFVATQAPTVEVNGEQLQAAGPSRAAAASRGELCARPGGTTPLYGCVNGVTVLDARSLDELGHMTLRGLNAEAPLAAPQLLAMSYVPPRGDLGAKLLMLVEDTAHAAEFDAQPRASTRAQSAAVVVLVQFDVASATQEWTLRLDECRGAMASNRSKPYDALKSHRYPAAVLAGGSPERPFVSVACHMVAQSLQGAVLRVPLTPSGAPAPLPVGPGQAGAVPGLPAAAAGETAPAVTGDHPGRRILVPGPDKVHEMIADPASGRIAMQVLDGEPAAQVWWIFDTGLMRFVGTVGIGGPVAPGASMSAVDGGRLYVLAKPETAGGRTFSGGLFAADIARTPVSQALVYPRMAERFPADYGNSAESARWALTVQRLDGGARRLWFPSSWNIDHLQTYAAIEDHRPDPRLPAPEDYAGRTLDLDEAEGVTDASLDGAARGYGVRVLLVGGAESLSRAGPADPVGSVEQCNDDDWGEENNAIANTIGPVIGGETSGGPCHVAGVRLTSPCLHGDREIVLAAVGPDGPAVVDGAGARGAANPITVDSLTGADLEAPVSRCAGQDWSQLWTAALFGRPPAGEPTLSTDLGELLAECVSGGQRTSGQSGDPVVNGYSAAVSCQEDEASGHAYARGTTVEGASVAEALSSFRIYRDPGRGIVARVESVARGVALDGVLRIDTVRGTAESWANGRRQPVERAQRPEGYDPDCDLERTAGTCFTRHVFGVRSPAYSCGPCGDEHALLEGLNAGLGPMGLLFQLREPDARLRQGAENGFTAAIQKPEADRFGDLVLNNDLLQTVLPTLEVIRNAAPNRVLSRKGSKGRQIYQFAGVEVSSSYGIACLHVYDAETGVCAPQAEPAGAIRVSLQDTGG
ncbi:MAG TPA: hypothetical protein VNU01_00405, partial [Egibacteraceae bacterium]|nr:hypothetical protein [Egibacteraceae bacterium]